MLNAKQVEDLLGVDASTVYRMAADGRLPAVRVGRQWRFPPEAVDRLLTLPDAAPTEVTSRSLPADLATAVLEAMAPALGVTMVVTDLAGDPLTPLVHPAPAIQERLDDPEFLVSCTSEWAHYAQTPHLAPRFEVNAHGFVCAHSLVRRGPHLVAMVLAGGIAPEGSDPASSAATGLFDLDETGRRRVLEALPRTAVVLSRLVSRDLPNGR